MRVKPTAKARTTNPATVNTKGVPTPVPANSITGMIPTTMTSGAFHAITLKNRCRTPRFPWSFFSVPTECASAGPR